MKKRRSRRTHKPAPSGKKRPPKSSGSPAYDLGACGEPFAEQKCQNFCDMTHDMIQVFKAEGAILGVNPAWRRALEYNDRDLAQLTVYNLIYPKGQKEAEDVFLAVSRDGKPRRFQTTLIDKNGIEVAVEGTVTRLPFGPNPRVLCGIFHDVTRRTQYEQLRDEFISTVSHELRTPLTVVREGVSQVRDGLLGPVPDDQKMLLDMVLQNADRLGRIIGELLDVSKLEAGKVRIHRRLCDIAEVAREVIKNFQMLAKRKKIEIIADFSASRIDIYIDRDKIVQVLTNLISNALRFTDKGSIKVQLRSRKGFVECRVADTGRGISKEDIPKAFEKFSQFGREVGPGDRGTGLGLPICKRLIELHHGRVKIESVPIKGTTVSFVLPYYTHRDHFKDTVHQALNRAKEEGTALSVIVFHVLNFEALEKTLGVLRIDQIVTHLELVINQALRRTADIAIKDTKAIMVLLPDTQKENAYIVLGRLSQAIEDHLIREQQASKVEVHSSVVCFPEEVRTAEEILDRIYA